MDRTVSSALSADKGVIACGIETMSIRIPEDLTVMGFCGYPGGRILAPSLSTVDLQYENIGHMAVDVLRHSEEWFGKTVPCLPTPHKLVPGGSTALGKTQI